MLKIVKIKACLSEGAFPFKHQAQTFVIGWSQCHWVILWSFVVSSQTSHTEKEKCYGWNWIEKEMIAEVKAYNSMPIALNYSLCVSKLQLI